MNLITLFLLAIGLSMDAFSVSLCKGLSCQKFSLKNALIVGLWFGGFQALMPCIGYLLGINFQSVIERVDHWIAAILLGVIGINMIKEAFSDEEEKEGGSFEIKEMFLLAVATSIDALAVGITFAFLKVQIILSTFLIGIITFCFSSVGVKLGNIFGVKYKSKAEVLGGIILILLGQKILFEHLGLLNL